MNRWVSSKYRVLNENVGPTLFFLDWDPHSSENPHSLTICEYGLVRASTDYGESLPSFAFSFLPVRRPAFAEPSSWFGVRPASPTKSDCGRALRGTTEYCCGGGSELGLFLLPS